MFTHSYRGWWLHGKCDSDEIRIQRPDYTIIGRSKNLEAAKRRIRRLMAK